MDQSPPNRLTDLLALSHVPRWTIVDMTRPQSVADHTYRTLVIALELSDRLQLPLSFAAVLYIICHDAAECRTGDIPSTAKANMAIGSTSKYCPWIASQNVSISEVEQDLIKMADLIEAYTFAARYGIGAHACRVVDWLTGKIKESGRKIDPYGEVVWALVEDIIHEKGRHP